MKFTAFVTIFALAVATCTDAAAPPKVTKKPTTVAKAAPVATKKPAAPVVTTVLCSTLMTQPAFATCEAAITNKKCTVGKDCDMKACCAKLKVVKPAAVACNTRTEFTCPFGFKKEGDKTKMCTPGTNCNSGVCCIEPTATVTVTATTTATTVSVTTTTETSVNVVVTTTEKLVTQFVTETACTATATETHARPRKHKLNARPRRRHARQRRRHARLHQLLLQPRLRRPRRETQ